MVGTHVEFFDVKFHNVAIPRQREQRDTPCELLAVFDNVRQVHVWFEKAVNPCAEASSELQKKTKDELPRVQKNIKVSLETNKKQNTIKSETRQAMSPGSLLSSSRVTIRTLYELIAPPCSLHLV